MKTVLIATTNNDKFDAVSKVFRNTIFPESEFIIKQMTKEMNVPDEKEEGVNVQRARAKALNAFNHLKEYDFDFIVGLDDALFVKQRFEPNIKEYINKILFENYLEDGEEFGFNRAYCIVDKNEQFYETNITIPYIYHPLKEGFKLEDHTYPLSKVSFAIGYDKPICELNEKDEIEYYLRYVKEGLFALNI